MQIVRQAVAGTLESSDLMVEIAPATAGLTVEIDSPVLAQYETQIRATVDRVLKEYSVTACALRLNDHGALDCTIEARLRCAITRAAEGGQA